MTHLSVTDVVRSLRRFLRRALRRSVTSSATLAALMLVLALGCRGGDRATGPGAEATNLRMGPSSVALAPGDTVQLEATPVDENGNPVSGYTISWSSGDTTVATVDGDGTVTGRAVGITTVTAAASKMDQASSSISGSVQASQGTDGKKKGLKKQSEVTVTDSTSATGNLEVITSTTGDSLDSDGYTVTVDGGSGQAIAINDTTVYADLTAEDHTVELTGVASNCSMSGSNPRTVSVPEDSTASTSFEVTCEASGSGNTSTGAPAPGPDATVVYSEGFESYSDVSELKGSYTTVESGGTINLDKDNGAEGSQSFRVDWAESDGSCDDADVLIEDTFNDRSGIEPSNEIYVRYYLKVDSDYMWDYSSGHDCNSSDKMFLIWRENADSYRFTNETTTGGCHEEPHSVYIWGEQKINPDCEIDLVQSMSGLVPVGPDAGTANVYQTHASANTEQVSMTDITDGRWHEIVIHIVNESVADEGDGVVEMWIDGTKVAEYLGNEPGHPAEGQVFTGTSRYELFKFPSVKNQGSPQAQSKWYDSVTVWIP